MPFLIVRNDIIRMDVDAIVNATNNELIPGGGVCGAIFQAAGSRELIRECRDIGFCRTGEAVLTSGYNLPAKYIIHTPGPIWRGGDMHEAELLAASYRNSLNLAKENGFESIAFPLISSGIYGYPVDKALETASVEIQKFLIENEMTVYLVLYDKESFRVGKKSYPDMREFISERLIPKARLYYSEQASGIRKKEVKYNEDIIEDKYSHISLNLMESFQNMLFRKIDESGMKDPEVYKKANIDRKLFSKIRSKPDYTPSKNTAIALGIGLELSYVEMQELLGKAGYTLSRSILMDVIIEYCLENKIYNIYKVNEILFEECGECLGLQ